MYFTHKKDFTFVFLLSFLARVTDNEGEVPFNNHRKTYIYIKFFRKTTGQTNFNYVEVPSCCEDVGMLRQWSLGNEGGALIKSSKGRLETLILYGSY